MTTLTTEKRTRALFQFITDNHLYEEFLPLAKRQDNANPIEIAENFIEEHGLSTQFHEALTEATTPDAPHNTLRAYDGYPIPPTATPERARYLRARNWHNLQVIDYNAYKEQTLLGRYILQTNDQKELSVYQVIRSTLLHATLQVLPHLLAGDPVHSVWGQRTSIPHSDAMAALIARVKLEKQLHEPVPN